MLLEALVQYYDTIPEPMLPGFRSVEVKWQLELDGSGKFVNFKALYGGSEKTHQGKKVELPFLDRSGANPPSCLIHDCIKYVIGGGIKPSNSKWQKLELEEQEKLLGDANVRHESYLELLDGCIEETGSETAKAIRSFISSSSDKIKRFLDQSSNWAFEDRILVLVDGVDPLLDDSIRAFWLGTSASRDISNRTSVCLVCGTEQLTMSKFFKKVKGIEKYFAKIKI